MRRILLHVCCAPCFIGACSQLENDYEIVLFWYNPNIEDEAEHNKRLEQFKKINVPVIEVGDYKTENKKWHEHIKGLEDEPEGGIRCKRCIEFRLKKTLDYAKKKGYSTFATTLTVSPKKDAEKINEIGEIISKINSISYLVSDFKRRRGYEISVKISKKLGLYRQNYCGCQYSKEESEKSEDQS